MECHWTTTRVFVQCLLYQYNRRAVDTKARILNHLSSMENDFLPCTREVNCCCYYHESSKGNSVTSKEGGSYFHVEFGLLSTIGFYLNVKTNDIINASLCGRRDQLVYSVKCQWWKATEGHRASYV